MKIIDISPYTGEIIETDEGTTYDRSGEKCYAVLMGNAWEPFDNPDRVEKLEQDYQAYKKEHEEGYEGFPESLKDMLCEAAKSVLGS